MLEGGWHIAQPKGHAFTLKETQCPLREGCILLGRLFHGGLPKSGKEVDSGVILTSTEGIDGIMYLRQWKGIILSPSIQLSKIDAKSKSSILFPD